MENMGTRLLEPAVTSYTLNQRLSLSLFLTLVIGCVIYCVYCAMGRISTATPGLYDEYGTVT